MNLFENVHESWIPLIHSLAYKEPLVNFLSDLRETSFQPAYKKIFKVFEMPVKDVTVVVLGQDPYPRPGDAIGRAFAVPEKSKMPLVLRNIEREVYKTEGIRVLNDVNDIVDQSWKTLNHWTEQGVFLLNTSLTVKTGSAGSHMKYWEEFTNAVISFLSHENPCVWLLWGDNAQKYGKRIQNPLIVKGYNRVTIQEIPLDPNLNYVVPGEHPAAKSRFMSKGFSDEGFYYTNIKMEKRNLRKITW